MTDKQLELSPLDTTFLPCDISFGNGKVGKGCSLRTLQLRITNVWNARQLEKGIYESAVKAMQARIDELEKSK